MGKLQDQRMMLRLEFTREKGELFSDNIPAYCDWIERKLAKVMVAEKEREKAKINIKALSRLCRSYEIALRAIEKDDRLLTSGRIKEQRRMIDEARCEINKILV